MDDTKFPQVRVEWSGARLVRGAIKAAADAPAPEGVKNVTVGYLVREGRSEIVVASTLTGEGEAVASVVIPRCTIRKLERTRRRAV